MKNTISEIKDTLKCPDWVAWLECHPIHQKVMGTYLGWSFILYWGTHGRQLIDASSSHLSFSLSLKINKKCPCVRGKKNILK